jgi:cytidine deaminase
VPVTTPVPAAVDWPALRAAATEAAMTAFAPYSGLHVGAAGITVNGIVISGCNVENASYGLTLCAECGLVSALRRAGEDTLTAVAVVEGKGRPLSLGELLPGAFDADDLQTALR